MKRGAALCLLLGGAALALTLTPTDADRQQAQARGQALAAKKQGYPIKDFMLYSVPDALTLTPGEGAVEAVQLATPIERVRWASYFLTIQGKSLTSQALKKEANLTAGQIAFIVFAHSQSGDETDQAFLKQFGSARLTLNSQVLTPVDVVRSGSSRNNYRDAGGQVVFRWTGTLTYRFAVPPGLSAAKGELHFVGAAGKAYDLKLDLAQYQ